MKEEHWKLNKDGSLAGVFAVDPTTGRYGDVWGRIGAAIETWVKLHPLEMARHLLDVEYLRQEQMNKFGSTPSKSLRYGCSVPVGLGRMLEIVEPELFTDKRLYHQFMKKFPAFRVCQVV